MIFNTGDALQYLFYAFSVIEVLLDPDLLFILCQFQMNEKGVLVSCVSLDGKLGTLEVMGSGALQLLQKILRPITLCVILCCCIIFDKMLQELMNIYIPCYWQFGGGLLKVKDWFNPRA